jgi:beta-glucanase (GH16 family)
MFIKATTLSMTMLALTCTTARSAVVWSDEFNGTEIDTETWIWDVGSHGFGNGQMEYNTARAKNSYIDNGSLVIEAFREDYFGSSFTSARLNTQGRFAFKYGTIEGRIKLPDTANGLWPAFWLLGNNFPGINWPGCGEIDILESGAEAGILNGTQNELINCAMHFSNATNGYQYNAAWIEASDYIGTDDLSADFHRYKMEWTPTDLTFYIDDVPYATWDITAPYFDEFHQPHFPIVNIAIGGWNYVNMTDPADVTALPVQGSSARMEIDWIRVEDNAYTEIILGEDTEETGNFGVFTETTPVNNALVYGDDTAPGWPYSDEAILYLWNNMTEALSPAAPSEGVEVWSFDVGAGEWFGMGVFLPNFRNMKNYSDGFLHFDIQTTLTDTIRIGVKSSRGGESWVSVGDETSGIGFSRDGNWHTVSIPLNGLANCDFNTAQQIFMLVADSASASTTLSIDNVWWEPSVTRPKPTTGSFGVFTETATNQTAGEYTLGVDGEFYVWVGDLGETLSPTAQSPYEGTNSMSFTGAGLGWFGAAFTPTVKYDLSAFDNPNGKLNFAMKSSSATTFYVGMKSGNAIGPPSPEGWANNGPAGVGQVWIKFAAGSDPYGFARDGNWHTIEIPIADITGDTDLSQVSQLFQILGVDGDISDIEFDNVYYSGGIAPQTNVVTAVVQYGYGVSWPSTDGSTYIIQYTDELVTNAVWQDLSAPIEGDWTTKTVFDPIGLHTNRFYQGIEFP